MAVKKYASVKYVQTKSAAQFLRYLDLSHGRWGPISEEKSEWVFRGHGNASWGLVPTAWRKTSRLPEFPHFDSEANQQWHRFFKHRPPLKSYARSIIVSGLTMTATIYELTYRFVQLCDELGFFVPGNIDNVHPGSSFLANYCHEWPDHAVDNPLLSFALAQHHGIPTNLLDWTRNAEYAAFFAADDNFELNSGPPFDRRKHELAVWALNLRLLNSREINSLHVLNCPRSENNFLHSQDALFVWYPRANLFYLENGRWPDFLDVLEARFSKARQKPVQKITLPANQVSILLHKLSRKRISKARLMPTYDNIFHTVYQNILVEAVNTI